MRPAGRPRRKPPPPRRKRSEEHTSELQSQSNLVCRLLLEKKNNGPDRIPGVDCCSSARNASPSTLINTLFSPAPSDRSEDGTARRIIVCPSLYPHGAGRT